MSDEQQNGQAPSFGLQRTYIKDLSLEMPNAPEIFLKQETPSIEVSIKVGGQQLAENIFESVVTATVTTRIEDNVLYLVELSQAGIFEASNIPAEQLDPLLGIVCPTMLYPYLRANIADTITRTSLPPVHLSEMNFQALYEQQQAQKAQPESGQDSGLYVPPGAK